jgi:hypothetical protein
MELTALRAMISAIRSRAGSKRIILFGSSSLLGSYPQESPQELGVEVTIDADFFIDPDDSKLRQLLDDELGEDNAYHQAHGY